MQHQGLVVSIVFCELVLLFATVWAERRNPAVPGESDPWMLRLIGVAQLTGVMVGAQLFVESDAATGLALRERMGLGTQVLVFYLAYTCANYWWHRARHTVPLLWQLLHSVHHAPRHMTSLLAWLRHPAEVACDLVVVWCVATLAGVDQRVVMIALGIEGALELMHHSNLRTPKRLRWLGYFVQLPEMHRVHHELGAHRFNYGTIVWDFVFGTLRFEWEPVPVGLRRSLVHYLLWRNVKIKQRPALREKVR